MNNDKTRLLPTVADDKATIEKAADRIWHNAGLSHHEMKELWEALYIKKGLVMWQATLSRWRGLMRPSAALCTNNKLSPRESGHQQENENSPDASYIDVAAPALIYAEYRGSFGEPARSTARGRPRHRLGRRLPEPSGARSGEGKGLGA